MSDPFIYVRDLVKVYKMGKIEVQALRGVNFEVEKGEFVAIMGPSGSGKTTLLNIMGGLDRPTAGFVKVSKYYLNEMSEDELVDFRRKVVGHIFQNLNLIPSLTARENIELSMVAAGVPKNIRKRRIEELLNIVDLEDRADHKPDELSGGEKQRVAIAAAIANDPPIILADEPTGELDTESAKNVVAYLRKINVEYEKTIIMVTHDPLTARSSDRIMMIRDGRIEASLSPTKIEEGSMRFVDTINERISSIEREILELDSMFKRGELDPEKYIERRVKLKKVRDILSEELHRIGLL
ncbi:MAG: ABC transporter ATP-binding protein [Candidatus Asgardarchaeia archaeon]